MLAVAAGVMIFLGIGGILYATRPFDLTRTGPLAVASAAFALAGIVLLAMGLRAGRSDDPD